MSKTVDKSNWKKQKTENNKNIYGIRVAITRSFYYNERKVDWGVIGMKFKKVMLSLGIKYLVL